MLMLDAMYYVVTDEFLAVAQSAVGGDGEFLEVREVESGRVDWVLNVTTTMDALDVKQSDVKRFSSGRIFDVTSYSFRPHIVSSLRVFRLSQFANPIFWTSTAVENLRRGGIVGIDFIERWSDPNDK